MTRSRPIVSDVTYVVARLGAATPTGIERVDAAYAHHFATRDTADGDGHAAAVHYGLLGPHGLSRGSFRRLIAKADEAWQAAPEHGRDAVFDRLVAWLQDPSRSRCPLRAEPRAPRANGAVRSIARARWRLADDRATIPPDAIYLNIAQYAFEYPFFFRWLDRRPDVKTVFFIHDLLPLDHPEFFRDGYAALFERRVTTMARFAQAAIVSNQTVADRLDDEMRRRGRPGFPIFSAPLPPPSGGDLDERPDDSLASAAPYFLIIGTIEPRKNHLLLLNLWSAMAETEPTVPRLILVGARGWDNEQVVDLLERSRRLAPHVAEVAGLSTPGLRRLIAQARAVLVPSFAEGYGLPLVEGLAQGTPVIASDIAVFREISQGKALLRDPLDGPGWRDAIAGLTQQPSSLHDDLVSRARRFTAPTWPTYFRAVEQFLSGL